MNDKKLRFSIDRGGTFTDIYCEVISDDGSVQCKVSKLLSEDPSVSCYFYIQPILLLIH